MHFDNNFFYTEGSLCPQSTHTGGRGGGVCMYVYVQQESFYRISQIPWASYYTVRLRVCRHHVNNGFYASFSIIYTYIHREITEMQCYRLWIAASQYLPKSKNTKHYWKKVNIPSFLEIHQLRGSTALSLNQSINHVVPWIFFSFAEKNQLLQRLTVSSGVDVYSWWRWHLYFKKSIICSSRDDVWIFEGDICS
jgi:hypothetical protein